MRQLFPILLGAWLLVFEGAAATLTALMDRDSITVGDTATLQLRFEGGAPQSAPAMPNIPNLTIQFAGQSQQRSIINGRISSALILSYAVTASQPGTYTIPAVSMPIDGQVVSSQPLKLLVTKDESMGTTGGPAYLRLQVSKTNVFVGEMIPIEIRVYGLIIDELQVPQIKSDGFTIGAQSPAIRGREQVGNAIYNTYSFQLTVAPAKAGVLTLGPAEATMLIRVPSQGRRRGMDIFEEMLGGYQRKQVTVQSESVAINVSPLPSANVPATFSGAIGNFQINVTASPTNVSVGDPISLKIEVSGKGSFDTVKLPDFGWKDFTFYPPNTAVTNTDALGTSAVKYFDQVIVPNRAGIAAIPPVVFSFFDPERRQYRSVSRPEIPISVKATGHGQAQPTVVADHGAPAQNQAPSADIVHIKPAIGQLSALGPPVALRPWFIFLQILPAAIFGGALFWRKQRERLANDPRRRRQKEVARYLSETLPQLREYAAKNNRDSFFATAFRLLQEQIGERLDLPAAAITEAVVDEKLPQSGAGPKLLQDLGELFQACNQARYAGSSVAGMEALIPKLESTLREVQKLGGTK